ncbi:MAG: hypothetical protein ACRDOI_42935 [Trebonia sp.]
MTVDCDSLALTDRDQHLVLYTAPPGSHDGVPSAAKRPRSRGRHCEQAALKEPPRPRHPP